MIAEKHRTSWRRLWAACVDGLVFIPVLMVGHFFWKGDHPVAIRAAWTLIVTFLPYAYGILCHGLYGQTVGKWLLRIRVLDVTETRLRMRQAFARDAISIGLTVWQIVANFDSIRHGLRYVLPRNHGPGVTGWIAVVWLVLELATVLASSRRRALHDLIAGSVVVRTGIHHHPSSLPAPGQVELECP